MKKNKFYAHKSAHVDQPARIGEGTKIWHFVHIMPGAKIGKEVSLGQNVYVGGEVVIGDYVRVQNNVSIYDGVILENHVFCGPSMVFTNDLNPRVKYPKNGHYSKTHIKEGASIGANATIVCGTVIGRHAFIGAGAVVTKDVPDYALVYGNPAAIKGWMCECGEKIMFKKNAVHHCLKCHKKYKKLHHKKIERIK